MSSIPFKIYALGSNGSGQLGIGHGDDVAVPTRCIFISDKLVDLPSDVSVRKIVAGGNHTLVMLTSGHVFAAGSDDFGQLGRRAENAGPRGPSTSPKFKRVKISIQGHRSKLQNAGELELFDDIAATWEASFFVKDHLIYVCGKGERGELGLGHMVVGGSDENVRVINLTKSLGFEARIRDIKASMSHVVVLLEDGQVVGWGAGRKGQLGNEARGQKYLWKPELICCLPLVTQKLAAGRQFTFLIGEREQWHIFLGEEEWLDRYLPDLDTFSLKKELNPEVDFELLTGWSHVYAITSSDRKIKGWGKNDRGQLPPDNLPLLKFMAAGSEHCVALTMDGEAIAWGWGEHGNCGQNVDDRSSVVGRWNLLSVELEDDEQVAAVGAGCATTFIATSKRILAT